MATDRQEEVIKNLVVKGGKTSKAKALRAAGYSEAIATNPKRVFESKGVRGIIEKMKEARDRAINKLEGKEDNADYSDLSRGIDVLTKNIQLLEGKPTENFKDLTDDALNIKLAEKITKVIYGLKRSDTANTNE